MGKKIVFLRPKSINYESQTEKMVKLGWNKYKRGLGEFLTRIDSVAEKGIVTEKII